VQLTGRCARDDNMSFPLALTLPPHHFAGLPESEMGPGAILRRCSHARFPAAIGLFALGGGDLDAFGTGSGEQWNNKPT